VYSIFISFEKLCLSIIILCNTTASIFECINELIASYGVSTIGSLGIVLKEVLRRIGTPVNS
jgi:hypothetical protein